MKRSASECWTLAVSNLKTRKREKGAKIAGNVEHEKLRECQEEQKKFQISELSAKNKVKDRRNDMLEIHDAEFSEETEKEAEKKKKMLKK